MWKKNALLNYWILHMQWLKGEVGQTWEDSLKKCMLMKYARSLLHSMGLSCIAIIRGFHSYWVQITTSIFHRSHKSICSLKKKTSGALRLHQFVIGCEWWSASSCYLISPAAPPHRHMHNGISSHISATHSFHRLLHWNGASSRIDREVGDGQPKNDHLAQGLYYLKTH